MISYFTVQHTHYKKDIIKVSINIDRLFIISTEYKTDFVPEKVLYLFFLIFILFIYLAVPGLSYGIRDLRCRVQDLFFFFSCGMRDLFLVATCGI